MKDAERHELAARALRGELSAEERGEFERQLATDTALRGAWQAEQALERALDRLPDSPVSSNFTSRVVQQVLRDRSRPQPQRRISLFQALARFAVGTAVVAFVCVGALQQRQTMHRREVAQTVNAFHDTAAAMAGEEMPSAEVLANFDTIRHLSLPAESELDLELLIALQR